MALPGWLMGLGAAAQGFQRQQQQQRQQQMVQALLKQRAMQQNPGGFGATPSAYGPQNWGAQNRTSGGVVRDQWGNPIGPAPQQAQGGAALPANSTPAASDPFSTGASGTPFTGPADPSLLAASQPPGLSPTSAVPFMGGPSQATPPQGVGGFQAPANSMDEAVISALFAPQGA